MKQTFRLKRSRDFKRVKETGLVIQNSLVVLVYAKSGQMHSRAAVVASRRIGNAVVRNKVKRRMRASLDAIWPDITQAWDLIFYARPKITEARFEDIQYSIGNLLLLAGVMSG